MKNYLKPISYLSAIMVALFIIVSCSKEHENKPTSEVKKSHSRVGDNYEMSLARANLLSYTLEEQKAVFDEMDSLERYNIWENKLQQVLSLEWSETQRTHIENLYEHLSPEVFSNDSASTLFLEFNSYFDYWFEQSNGILTYEDVRGIVVSPVDLINIQNPNDGGDADDMECGCNRNNDWCIWSMDCSGKCIMKTRTGCGGFWRRSCNGTCE